MLDVSEVGVQAYWRFEDFLTLARAVYDLAPDCADEAARAGLIHVALRQLGPPGRKIGQDSISAAVERARGHSANSKTPIPADLARVLSLTFAAQAGDLPDPTGGADFVLPHGLDGPGPDLLIPVALLGGFLFFKTAAPI